MNYTAGMLGGYEILIIVVIVLLLFGGKKIPELARGLGKGVREFKSATKDSDLANDIKDIKKDFDNVKKDVEDLDPRKLTPKNPLKSKKK